MKLTIDKEWLRKKAEQEGDLEIGAGSPSYMPPFVPSEADRYYGKIIDGLMAERQRTDDLIEEVKRVLGPFAKAGHVIDGPFGPALFAEDDMAFKSGCAWSENGVSRTITWGDFRRARALLSKLEGR